ncbi:MAG TPA: hypothetical protein VIF35_18280, partial [Streptosporangiaceae bacterium]
MAEQDPGAVGGSGDGEPGQLSAEHRAGPDDQANVWPGSGQRTWLESDEVWPDSNGQFWPGSEELWPAASPRGWPNEDAAAAEPDTGQPGGEPTPGQPGGESTLGQPGGESTEAWLDSLVAQAGTAVPAPADGAQPGLTEPGLTEPGLTEPGLSEPGTGQPAGGLPESWPAADSAAPAQVTDIQPSASAPDPVSWASEPATPVAGPPGSGTGLPGGSRPATGWPAATGSGSR